MRIQNSSRNNQNFTGLLNNRMLLRGLEKISEHGTSFSAGTSLVMSLTMRPLAIFSTPDVEKENKQYACANSICSGLVKFAMVEAIALPIENAVKNIDKKPEKFLKPQTIKNLQDISKQLPESKNYKFATQLLKLGTGFVTAVPKSMLTIAFIPIIMDKIFHYKKNEDKISKAKPSENSLSFTGNYSEKLSSKLAKLLNNKKIQDFVKKHSNKNEDIAKHITAATDILLTSSFALQTQKSDNISEHRKKALIYNNVISTGITLVGGYGVDRIIKKKTNGFIEKFSQINKADPKLHKYIEGINILRPAIIFAAIYYGLLPIFSTYLAEKIDKYCTPKA